jgi:hypothetical protein
LSNKENILKGFKNYQKIWFKIFKLPDELFLDQNIQNLKARNIEI